MPTTPRILAIYERGEERSTDKEKKSEKAPGRSKR
jgi:hypothetical protein